MANHNISYDDADAPWNGEAGQDPSNWNDDVVAEFRANAGQVGGDYTGHPLILLTTTGARSGELRVVPLAPNYRGDTLYLSSFREDRDPDWFHNIRANPAVTGRGVLEYAVAHACLSQGPALAFSVGSGGGGPDLPARGAA